ncbi:hypothetical protein VXN63_05500 [Marinilactibacillus sp. XAAS-LB27]|uniref:hypothetical protein n=1 Tax=Marinilactibacillus sp. XAAS-LB27 TaxID=3114538 RepID=UPI002E179314|nr:hypothetical protein [Marinilactibacillus sp. XAAS-LB27]
MAIIGAILPILLMLILVGMIIMLQVYLSKTDSKFPGLILPFISFLFALMTTVGIASYLTVTPSYEETTSIEVMEVNEYDDSEEAVELSEGETGVTLFGEEDGGMESGGTTTSMILSALGIFLLSNILTLILIVIYILTRKRMNKERSVNRTRIQDL